MIIVFPWSFDPFHTWHKNTVLRAQDRMWEEVRVLITNTNPNKLRFWEMRIRIEIAQELLGRDTNILWIGSKWELLSQFWGADYILKWYGRSSNTELKDWRWVAKRVYLFPLFYKLKLIKSDLNISSSQLLSWVESWDIESALNYTTEKWIELLKSKLTNQI